MKFSFPTLILIFVGGILLIGFLKPKPNPVEHYTGFEEQQDFRGDATLGIDQYYQESGRMEPEKIQNNSGQQGELDGEPYVERPSDPALRKNTRSRWAAKPTPKTVPQKTTYVPAKRKQSGMKKMVVTEAGVVEVKGVSESGLSKSSKPQAKATKKSWKKPSKAKNVEATNESMGTGFFSDDTPEQKAATSRYLRERGVNLDKDESSKKKFLGRTKNKPATKKSSLQFVGREKNQ